jgi:hypothetical protein
MGEYFKPWRRKVGCVTLIVACVFAAGWVRSFYVVDDFGFDWSSSNGSIAWSKKSYKGNWIYRARHQPKPRVAVPEHEPIGGGSHVEAAEDEWTVLEEFGPLTRDEMRREKVRRRQEQPQYESSVISTYAGEKSIITVHYSFVAVPLTLLSVWLLLKKPRVVIKAPVKLTESN